MNPDSCAAGDAECRQTEIGRGMNHGLFEGADIPVSVAADRAEIDDWIAHNLPETVIGNVPAAIRSVELDALLTEDVFAGKKIFAFRISPESNDVRVFAEQQHIGERSSFAGGDKSFLQREGFLVGDKAEVGGKERIHARSSQKNRPENRPLHVDLQAADGSKSVAHSLPDCGMRGE